MGLELEVIHGRYHARRIFGYLERNGRVSVGDQLSELNGNDVRLMRGGLQEVQAELTRHLRVYMVFLKTDLDASTVSFESDDSGLYDISNPDLLPKNHPNYDPNHVPWQVPVAQSGLLSTTTNDSSSHGLSLIGANVDDFSSGSSSSSDADDDASPEISDSEGDDSSDDDDDDEASPEISEAEGEAATIDDSSEDDDASPEISEAEGEAATIDDSSENDDDDDNDGDSVNPDASADDGSSDHSTKISDAEDSATNEDSSNDSTEISDVEEDQALNESRNIDDSASSNSSDTKGEGDPQYSWKDPNDDENNPNYSWKDPGDDASTDISDPEEDEEPGSDDANWDTDGSSSEDMRADRSTTEPPVQPQRIASEYIDHEDFDEDDDYTDSKPHVPIPPPHAMNDEASWDTGAPENDEERGFLDEEAQEEKDESPTKYCGIPRELLRTLLFIFIVLFLIMDAVLLTLVLT